MKIRACLALALLASIPCLAFSRLPLPADVFEVDGRKAFVMKPEKAAAGKPWVWYAPTLGNYPRNSQKYYFDAFVKQGIAVAGYDLGEVRGAPGSSAKFTKFYDAMVKKGYSKKPILLGQSRGGLMMLCWGFRNPEKVGAFVGIYPVCNLTSWALKHSKPSVERDYGMSEADLLKRLKEFNPPDNLAPLAKAKVPMFIIHGDSDGPVPMKDNSSLIDDAYKKLGGTITLKVIPGKGHAEIPEFFKDADLVRFVSEQAKY